VEEQIIKEVEAAYFKSATNMLKGNLTLTNKRIYYSGEQERLKVNHGLIGNVVRDKMESAMGYDKKEEEFIFDIPLGDATAELKRFGLSKRLLIRNKSGEEFKLMLTAKKDERDSWPGIIENAKKENQ